MQHQKESHVATVEDLLIQKLYEGGFLSTKIYGDLVKKDKWSRAARTDKGVHAVVNAISCLFQIDKKYYNEDHTLNVNKIHLDLKDIFS